MFDFQGISRSLTQEVQNIISRELSSVETSFNNAFNEIELIKKMESAPTISYIKTDEGKAEEKSIVDQVTNNINVEKYTAGEYSDIVNEMSDKYNVPSQLIHAVIRAESNYDPNAVSSTGAQGLMQLMPPTAKSLGVTDSFDPRQNIEGGVNYLSQMIERFDGNIKLSLAAYNAGPGNVEKYNGIPPFDETVRYVDKIMNSFK